MADYQEVQQVSFCDHWQQSSQTCVALVLLDQFPEYCFKQCALPLPLTLSAIGGPNGGDRPCFNWLVPTPTLVSMPFQENPELNKCWKPPCQSGTKHQRTKSALFPYAVRAPGSYWTVWTVPTETKWVEFNTWKKTGVSAGLVHRFRY